MKKYIFYIHGLGSNGNGNSATLLQKYLGDEYEVISKDIPFDPYDAMDFIKDELHKKNYSCIIGTSLGGFYASLGWGVIPKIIVNPALSASSDIAEKIGKGTYEYFDKREDGKQTYTIDDKWLNKLWKLEECFDLEMYERISTWGFFGENDDLINHQEDFKRNYIGKSEKLNDRFNLIPCGHRLNENVIRDYIAPKIKEITNIKAVDRYNNFWGS